MMMSQPQRGARVLLAGMQIPPNLGPTYCRKRLRSSIRSSRCAITWRSSTSCSEVALPELMQADGTRERGRPKDRLRQRLARAPRRLARTMTDKPWARAYPPGVPAEIDPDRYASLCDLLEASFARYSAAPAFSNLGSTLSFAEIDRQSRAFAAYLQSLPGLDKGERVAVMLPNTLQSPVAIFGVLRAGLVAVNVNPQYTIPELEHQLADSGARVVVVLENFAATVEHALPNTQVRHVIVSRIGDRLPWPSARS
jgi:non-ribosomal peptide synthetase component F